MLTIEIKINGKEILSTSAVNVGAPKSEFPNPPTVRVYSLNNGKEVWHDRREGALSLAKKVLMQYRDEDYFDPNQPKSEEQ